MSSDRPPILFEVAGLPLALGRLLLARWSISQHGPARRLTVVAVLSFLAALVSAYVGWMEVLSQARNYDEEQRRWAAASPASPRCSEGSFFGRTRLRDFDAVDENGTHDPVGGRRDWPAAWQRNQLIDQGTRVHLVRATDVVVEPSLRGTEQPVRRATLGVPGGTGEG